MDAEGGVEPLIQVVKAPGPTFRRLGNKTRGLLDITTLVEAIAGGLLAVAAAAQIEFGYLVVASNDPSLLLHSRVTSGVPVLVADLRSHHLEPKRTQNWFPLRDSNPD